MRERVRKVVKEFNAVSMPSDVEQTAVEHWRGVARHFISQPHEDFDDNDAFFVVDLARVAVQMAKFRNHLPMVEPYYAVKCNDNPALLAMIAALGGGFDCASSKEMRQVLRAGLVPLEMIIFANPCKSLACMRTAENLGVRQVTFDNIDELDKLAKHMPSCKALVRIATNDINAVCAFSCKFGAPMNDVPAMLDRARELGVCVTGVSFHVGSGNSDASAYVGAIQNARAVFEMGTERGFEMKVLDVGGGFPGDEPPVDAEGRPLEASFEVLCESIAPALREHFPNTSIIAEPGRFFAASTHMLAMNVHSRRVLQHEEHVEHQYYVNDGLYHSFNCLVYDHVHPPLYIVDPDEEARTHLTSIFGPTCDGLDCILKKQPFPELEIGDWIFVPSFGAYTSAGGGTFNGFQTRRIEYMNSLPHCIGEC